jgi:hypothetical protein
LFTLFTTQRARGIDASRADRLCADGDDSHE